MVFSLTDAAGLPEVYCTVWTNMMDRCALKPAETVLVQGGTSGIGCAVRSPRLMARWFSPPPEMTRNAPRCAGGADHQSIIVTRISPKSPCANGRSRNRCRDRHRGVDIFHGKSNCWRRMAAIMILNLLAEETAEVDFGHVHSRHLTITGARLPAPRSICRRDCDLRALEGRVWPLIADGSIRR